MPTLPREPLGLVGDIGGTNARFALVSLSDAKAPLFAPRSLPCADYPTVIDAIGAYLAQSGAPVPTRAAIAVAGPVADRAIRFTNLDWAFSETQLIDALKLQSASLLNDYAALAIAAPALTDQDVAPIGSAQPADGPIAILGAGTGLGVSVLARGERSETVVSTEGGHTAFAPTDALEVEILKVLMNRFGRVSNERILSGPGLLNLYLALCEIEQQPVNAGSQEQVSALAQSGDATAEEALDRFCAILGSVAGDFALSFGATGGVLIAGGIAPRMLDRLRSGAFRRRFEDKGRFQGFNAAIATSVITHPHAALIGSARKVRQMAMAT